jgi:hypothetical protein
MRFPPDCSALEWRQAGLRVRGARPLGRARELLGYGSAAVVVPANGPSPVKDSTGLGACRSAATPWRARDGEDQLLSEASRDDVFRVVANGPAFGTRLTADQISDHRADAPRYEKRRKGLLLNLLAGIPSSIGRLLVDLSPHIRRLPAYLSDRILYLRCNALSGGRRLVRYAACGVLRLLSCSHRPIGLALRLRPGIIPIAVAVQLIEPHSVVRSDQTARRPRSLGTGKERPSHRKVRASYIHSSKSSAHHRLPMRGTMSRVRRLRERRAEPCILCGEQALPSRRLTDVLRRLCLERVARAAAARYAPAGTLRGDNGASPGCPVGVRSLEPPETWTIACTTWSVATWWTM